MDLSEDERKFAGWQNGISYWHISVYKTITRRDDSLFVRVSLSLKDEETERRFAKRRAAMAAEGSTREPAKVPAGRGEEK